MISAREKAVLLRREGYSYRYISEKTGLSKSTLSYHLRDISYTANKETIKHVGKARARSAETKARLKKDSFLLARKEAKKSIGDISHRDLFMLGLGLYIGEGSKTQDIIRVVNADHRVILLFIRWILSLGYTRKHVVVRIHLYPDSNIKTAEEFWSQKLGIPPSQFQKACIDYRVQKDQRRKSKYRYGTAHVTLRSLGKKELGVMFSRKIGAWMEEVLE